MKLLLQTIKLSLQEYDEGIFNQEYPIQTYFHVAQICSLLLNEPIPDFQKTKQIYAEYIDARIQGQHNRELHYINLLKKQQLKAEPLIKKLLDKYKNVQIEEEERPEVYQRDALGVLAWEDP